MPERHYQSGLAITEILVAMAILGIVITGIYNLFRVHSVMAARQEETTLMQQELLSIMLQMTDDLRMCGYTTTSGNNFGFITPGTNASSIYCTSDRDGDGVLDANSTEHLAYRISGNSIESFEPSNATWVLAASNISALNIIYFDSDEAVIPNITNATARNIRFVDITATATASPERSALAIRNRSMTTRVYCRNTGL